MTKLSYKNKVLTIPMVFVYRMEIRIELSSGQMQQQLKVFTLMNYNFLTFPYWVIGALTLKLWERYTFNLIKIYNEMYYKCFIMIFLDEKENN